MFRAKKSHAHVDMVARKRAGGALVLALAMASSTAAAETSVDDCLSEGAGKSVWSVTEPDASIECGSEPVEMEQEGDIKGLDDSPFWQFPALTGDYEGHSLIDTDPGTRAYAEERLVNRLNYRYNKVNRANRVHIKYGINETEPSESSLQLIHSLIDQMAQDGDTIVITGYESQDNGLLRAKSRVDALVSRLNLNRDVYIEKDATGFWPGEPSESDRVEVFLIPRL